MRIEGTCVRRRTGLACMRSFGVRQLAAAFLSASLLAGISSENNVAEILTERTIPSQQAGWCESGSKLPHSKASHARTRSSGGL